MAAGHHTTAFRVGSELLIDAGSGVGTMPLSALQEIQAVFVTHAHLDHILALPLLADAVLRHRQDHQLPPLMVYGLPETLDALQRHIFNQVVWPDFTRIPSVSRPVVRLQPVQVGDCIDVGPCSVQVLPAQHVVPAVGYAVWERDRPEAPVWGYSGDTGPNPAIWPVLRQLPNLRVWITEVAFSNQDQVLAERSGHHCPASLEPELLALAQSVDVLLTHLKPGEWDRISAEVGQLKAARPLRLLQHGDQFVL